MQGLEPRLSQLRLDADWCRATARSIADLISQLVEPAPSSVLSLHNMAWGLAAADARLYSQAEQLARIFAARGKQFTANTKPWRAYRQEYDNAIDCAMAGWDAELEACAVAVFDVLRHHDQQAAVAPDAGCTLDAALLVALVHRHMRSCHPPALVLQLLGLQGAQVGAAAGCCRHRACSCEWMHDPAEDSARHLPPPRPQAQARPAHAEPWEVAEGAQASSGGKLLLGSAEEPFLALDVCCSRWGNRSTGQ